MPIGSARGTLTLVPGIFLSLAIALTALGVQLLEEARFGHPYVEALVLAILLGTALRSVWVPPESFRPGIAFSAKQVLEFAVMLLGSSLSLGALAASGPALIAGIVATVVIAIAAGYGICRSLGLPSRLSILVACGNAICGNSAIAAVAPVIGADSKDVAASIAFTAVLGVVMVLGLPLFIPLVGLSETQYGVLAGLTVYAVPQVLAATVPVGLVSTQVGTLVKLIRVLMLGPVVLLLAVMARRVTQNAATAAARPARLGLSTLVPWFIIGFLLLATARSVGIIPDDVARPVAKLATYLTILSMAALGIGVDVRVLARVGRQVTLAVTGSLAILLAVSLMLIWALSIA